MKTNGELRARISSLEIQLDRSKREIEQQREEFLSKGAKATNMLCDADDRMAELEAQQAVLVEALTEYMAAYNEHWERGMPILEPMGDSALAAVKPALSPWQPIETAPQDGTPILGWCSHEADSGERAAGALSHYAMACEGLGHVKDGYNVVSWVEESLEGSWEEGYYTVPGYWALDDEYGECCANPTHWMPLPATPVKPAGQKGSE